MEVILTQDIPKVGYKNDVITVKNGFAMNYLIPKGYAILATESAKKMNAETLKQRAFKEEKIRKENMSLAERLKDITIKVGAKAGSTGKIYGSVNAIQIAEAIKNQFNIEVDRKKISIVGDSVKELGNYTAKIHLHKDINVNINFEVIAE